MNSIDDLSLKRKGDMLQEVKQEARDPENPGHLSWQLEPKRKRNPHPRGEWYGWSRPGYETGPRYEDGPTCWSDSRMRFHFNGINR